MNNYKELRKKLKEGLVKDLQNKEQIIDALENNLKSFHSNYADFGLSLRIFDLDWIEVSTEMDVGFNDEYIVISHAEYTYFITDFEFKNKKGDVTWIKNKYKK